VTSDIDQKTKFLEMMVETTRIILTAATDQTIAESSKQSIHSGLEILMKSIIIADPVDMLEFECALAYHHQFKLRVKLIEMLTKHESCQIGSAILQAAIDLVDICDILADTPGNKDPYNEMMDNLGDMMRHFLLAHADKLAAELQVRINSEDKTFIDSFIASAGYSSQPGHSKKLFRTMLSAMNANTVKSLRRELSKRQTAMDKSTHDTHRTFITIAMKSVEQIQTPFSLEVLSRLAMRKALRARILNEESLTSDVIPVHMRAYVLNQE